MSYGSRNHLPGVCQRFRGLRTGVPHLLADLISCLAGCGWLFSGVFDLSTPLLTVIVTNCHRPATGCHDLTKPATFGGRFSWAGEACLVARCGRRLLISAGVVDCLRAAESSEQAFNADKCNCDRTHVKQRC